MHGLFGHIGRGKERIYLFYLQFHRLVWIEHASVIPQGLAFPLGLLPGQRAIPFLQAGKLQQVGSAAKFQHALHHRDNVTWSLLELTLFHKAHGDGVQRQSQGLAARRLMMHSPLTLKRSPAAWG